jgi:hypothetical protein
MERALQSVRVGTLSALLRFEMLTRKGISLLFRLFSSYSSNSCSCTYTDTAKQHTRPAKRTAMQTAAFVSQPDGIAFGQLQADGLLITAVAARSRARSPYHRRLDKGLFARRVLRRDEHAQFTRRQIDQARRRDLLQRPQCLCRAERSSGHRSVWDEGAIGRSCGSDRTGQRHWILQEAFEPHCVARLVL